MVATAGFTPPSTPTASSTPDQVHAWEMFSGMPWNPSSGAGTGSSSGSSFGNTLSGILNNGSATASSAATAGTNETSPTPSAPPPVYNGPHINSIPHLATSLGASYTYNPTNGSYTVNGQQINPSSVVGGVGHAPVVTVAQAAGIHPSDITTTKQGVTVNKGVNTSDVNLNPNPSNGTPYGQYWANVQKEGGAFRDPKAYGQSIQDAIAHEAALYHIDPSQVQVTSGGHTFVPWQYVKAELDRRQAANQPTQQTQTQPTSPGQQIGDLGNSFLQGIQQSAPQAPPPVQMPTFDLQSYLNQMQPITPFQFDPNQDFMNQYQAQLPAFNQQLTTEDQRINEGMNKRGIYTSGIAQNAVDTQNQALYGKLIDSIQKGSLADQKQAYTEWLGQANLLNKQNQDFITNALNAYKANVQSLFDQGKLNLQQYQASIGEWNDMVKAAQDVFNQQSKQIMQTQAEQASMQQKLLPWTMGPTPAQVLPYQMPTAYQQGQLDLGQQRLQLQAAQYAQSDQQKWAQIMGVGPDGQPTLDAQKLQAQISHDAQTAATAAANASDNQVKTQISGLHDQLVAAGQFITNLTAQGVKANDPTMQQAIQNYNNIDGMIQSIVASIGTGQTSGASGPLAGTSSPQ